MKLSYKSRYCLLALLLLMSLNAWTQQKNVLSVPDAKVSIGQAQLPVIIENTDMIVAAQFDLTLPSTILAGTDAVLANRCDGHTVIIKNMGATRYRVMLYSDENRPLLAQQGIAFYIPLSIPNTVTEGSELPLVITNATLSVAGGANVLTDTKAGKLIVSTLPDLTVKDIRLGDDAPSAEITPGERLSLSWQVQNVGGADTGGGWSEQILLVNKRGTIKKLIGTVYQQETLAAGDVMSRQADVIVPQLLGIEGEAYIQVHVIANSETGESALATGNNSAQADGVFTVGKRLFVELNPARIVENYGHSIAVKLSRSGNWNSEQTFTLSSSDDSRVTLPAQITVPIGQSGSIVYMTVIDNNVLNNDSIVTITADGNGYTAVTGQLTIEDNEYPNLTLTASTSQVTEGETFQLTVTTSRVSATPIEVTITSENSKRFSFPSKVTIPAGETSAMISVEAIDDELPSLELSNSFTASAPNYNKAEVIVILQDNDLPVLTLEVTPNKISEGDGVVAVAGVLRRTTNTNSKITVKLSDDADGGLYFSNRTLELSKGVEEVHFNFGPVDNALMDGDRTYTITAAVWLSSCNCGASGESAGYVSAELQVLDNDGPALKLTSSLGTFKEGEKTTLTITRNTTDNTQPLTVTLQSDYDDNLTYNHTVTIPAGQTSATVEVTSKGNDVQGDSHTVVFTAQAEGYATGTCYLMVTDQTQPDARISSITANVTEAEVGAEATLTIVVTNDGAADLSAKVPVNVYHRGDANAVETIYTTEAIPVGSSQTLTKAITLPTTVGTQNYYAVVNESNKVQELTYTNNTSADVTIVTIAPFAIAINTDKTIYKQGEKVIITGQLTGNGIAETDIDIYLVNEGARQVQTVKTDAQGTFSYEWQLYVMQSGHFAVGACYHGEGSKLEMASFDVCGLKRTENNYITCEVNVGETFNGEIGIENPCGIEQENVHVELLSEPSDCELSFESIEVIGGGERTTLKYQITGLNASSGNEWNTIKALLVSNSGASMPLTLYYYCRMPLAQLEAEVPHIETTIVMGTSREYPITITNRGANETGVITLALPSFMSVLSSQPIPSLLPNESTTIFLQLSYTDQMHLNVPISGYIGLNCEYGNGVTLPYTIVPVSESTGELLVDVCDEYTYYTDEKPHVKGARIKIQRPFTKELLYEGVTGDDGIYLINLPEGYYTLSVSADKHESYERNILIDPGRRNSIVVNLSYTGGVSVNWDVVETEIEDEYTITSTITYETNVPVPILELDVPSSIPAEDLGIGESLIFYATLTNRGLITIHEAQIILPEDSPGLLFESLQGTSVDLSAQQSIVIPVKVTRIDSNPSSRRMKSVRGRSATIISCTEIIIPTGFWICGKDKKWHRKGGKSIKLGEFCTEINIGNGGIGGSFDERSDLPLLGRLSGANFDPYIPYIPDIFPEINIPIPCDSFVFEEPESSRMKADRYKNNAGQNESVCATITLQISQIMTLTRPAYRGTLTLFNGNDDTAMTDVKLDLVVKDEYGNLATAHEFQINTESIDGFDGELTLSDVWSLDAKQTGKVTVLFIPTKYAAPTEPVKWSFGGTLSYNDPTTGLRVSRNLIPVTFTVKPLPDLELTYLMQRDIYGDDPLTTDVVEPMQPAEFALIINNKGYGDAQNVRMQTEQPKIIENEKGLFIDFNIKSSQVNGNMAELSLGQTIVNNFGTIPAHSQAYAQWWLESSLLGHFTSYKVEATHVTSYDNHDLSLVDTVTIHEMIHGFTVDESRRGYLVNDIADVDDMPDIIYFTDGTTTEMAVAVNATWEKQSNTEYLLTVTPSQAGWNYGHITDPTYGRATLVSIRRQSDGKSLPLDNFWQTDRTLRDAKDWLYENNLHFTGLISDNAETYVLTFEPRPDVELQVASFEGVPEEGTVLREPLQTVTVTFNKAIDASTFTREDITLNCQGERLEDPIAITPVSDTRFTLDLSQLTARNGYYVLTIQTAGITDFEGFNGAAGKMTTWIQFTEATTLALSFYEAEVTYGDNFTKPRVSTNSLAAPTFTSTNPLVASVDANTGDVIINAVGTTKVKVNLEETPMSDAATTAYTLTVLQPEGNSEAPAGVETVNITIPDGETMVTYCSPWPIDFRTATNDCRAYVALSYHDDIVECKEVAEAKGGVGLLIAGKPGTYIFPVRTSFNDPDENLFVGTLAPTYLEEMTDNKTNLGLRATKFVPLDAGVVKANMAYLPIEMENGVDFMNIVLQSLTGLRIITEQTGNDAWYHISGMKVNRPSAKGIYIQNGRKVVVK